MEYTLQSLINKTVKELKELCKYIKIKGYSKQKTKVLLISYIITKCDDLKNNNIFNKKFCKIEQDNFKIEQDNFNIEQDNFKKIKYDDLKKESGKIAQENGNKFEDIIVNYYNNENNKKQIFDKLNILYPDIPTNGYFLKCFKNKVKSIHSKLTTRKSDMWYIYKNDNIENKIGISIKMSNNGTQLQIISLDIFEKYLEYNNIKLCSELKNIFKKFLGIIKPNREEQNILNKNRTEIYKDKQRWLMNEFSNDYQNKIINFLKINYFILLKLVLSDGLCINKEDKAEIFVLNDENFTKNNKINPYVLTFDDFIKTFKHNNPNITKNGSLELNNLIGLQRKGSGKENSACCLQFKDRGFTI